jgi:hypothetical protein
VYSVRSVVVPLYNRNKITSITIHYGVALLMVDGDMRRPMLHKASACPETIVDNVSSSEDATPAVADSPSLFIMPAHLRPRNRSRCWVPYNLRKSHALDAPVCHARTNNMHSHSCSSLGIRNEYRIFSHFKRRPPSDKPCRSYDPIPLQEQCSRST